MLVLEALKSYRNSSVD